MDCPDARSSRAGSSPRAWGTHAHRHPDPGRLRFIPTCMGNAAGSTLRRRKRTVHPHVHGEREYPSVFSVVYCGSSPRAWGTPIVSGLSREGHRFIPTCMGNARRCPARSSRSSVHPHVHGERTRAGRDRSAQYGSSPRAWGTLIVPRRGRLRRRFIPTCMGNARGVRGRRGAGSVHPHVHGERDRRVDPEGHLSGSSPRAWGTL